MCKCVMASKDQVDQPVSMQSGLGARSMSGSLRASSGCESTCVSLGARAQGDRLWDMESPGQLCVCVCLTVCTSNWSRAAALGTFMSRCQQLGRLGSRSSYWAECLSPAAGGIHFVRMSMYILTCGLPSCPTSQRGEQDEAVGAPYVHVGALSVCL